MASIWPLADMALANGTLPLGLSVLLWPLAILLVGLLAMAILKPFLGSWERATAVAAPAIICFFSFSAIEPIIRQGLALVGADRGAAIVFILLWLGLCGTFLRLACAPDVPRFLLIFPVLAVLSTLVLAFAGQPAAHSVFVDRSDLTARFETRPNVYHFLFDGLGRPDTLKAVLNLDVGSGPAELAKRGFVLSPRVLAAQLATVPSLTSLLAPRSQAASAGDIDIADSPVAHVFQKNGYLLAQYGEVFSFAACKGRQDVCLSNSQLSLSEIDIAMMRRTPVYPAINRYILRATSSGRMFSNLDLIASTVPKRPTYTFSYMVPPHPPFIFGKGCVPDQVDDNDYRVWSKTSIVRYGQSYRCVMQGMIRVVDRIIARDPGAIIIISGDHGTMFLRSQTDSRPWTAAAIAERRPVFLASRLPEPCRKDFLAIQSLEDVYPQLFDCLSRAA